MRIGACLHWNHSKILKEAGGDFIELPLSAIANLKEKDFEELPRSLPLPAEAFNILLPSDFKIVGDDVDWERIKNYLELAFGRAKLLGGEVIVFGSGRARRREADYPKEKTKEKIAYFLFLASEIGEKWDLKIAIEHLNREETNTINTLSEALEFAEESGRENVGVIADFYHLIKENECWDVLKRGRKRLFHIHISDQQRRPPSEGNGLLTDFLIFLKEIGYGDRISLECRWQEIERELPLAINFLKNLLRSDER
ncbi:MAG: sugar phosphate isomerase/epimerase family protein [bacterium]